MLHLLIAFTIGGGQPTAYPDRWFAPDKVQHFFMSAFIQSVGYSAFRQAGMTHRSSLVGASAITFSVGAGKELWDATGRGDPSLKDLTADVAGAAAASVLLNQTRR